MEFGQISHGSFPRFISKSIPRRAAPRALSKKSILFHTLHQAVRIGGYSFGICAKYGENFYEIGCFL